MAPANHIKRCKWHQPITLSGVNGTGQWISNTFYTVGFYTVDFYTVKIYTIIFYTVIFYTVAKFIRSFFIRSKFILVQIYTGQNLYRSKFIWSKFILCIVEAYSHCADCQVVLWQSHVIFEQLQLHNDKS
jgi:hypothetical protein